MAYRDLQAFIAALEKRGKLTRVSAPVSPVLEITEIADRVMKRGGGALLFENVEGSRYPMLINAMGSDERMALALGAGSLDEIGADVPATSISATTPPSISLSALRRGCCASRPASPTGGACVSPARPASR